MIDDLTIIKAPTTPGTQQGPVKKDPSANFVKIVSTANDKNSSFVFLKKSS
jgi:hypothetical protein